MKALYISGIILFFYYIYKNYKSNNLNLDIKSLWVKYHPKDILDKEILKVMLENDTKIFNGGSDQYVYVCNAADNGTTNPASGTLTVIIEYYGID